MDDILIQNLNRIVEKFPDEADFRVRYYSNESNSLKEVTDEDFRSET